MAKKTVDIEALVRWAYRDELPKAAATPGRLAVGFKTGWGGVERYGELLAVIDEPDVRNRFGLFPDRFADGEPHDDAVRVHDAVMALQSCEMAMPEGWNPIADMGDLGPEGPAAVARALAGLTLITEKGDAVLRRSVSRLVIRHAILGGCPAWEGDVPARRLVTAQGGKVRWFRRVLVTVEGAFGPVCEEVELDGFDPKRREPFPDAYTKTILDPDPEPVVQGRAEYELWRAALDILAEDLDGALDAHDVRPSARSARPWERPDPERRILPSLLVPPVPERVTRAGRQKKKQEAA
jgi:hypothetical protein